MSQAQYMKKPAIEGPAGRWRAAALATLFALSCAGDVVWAQPLRAAPVSVDAPAPRDFSPIVKAVRPAVVSVRVQSDGSGDEDEYRRGFRQGDPREQFRRFFDQFGGNPFFDFREEGQRGERRMPERPRRNTTGQGSGFFVEADGYIVTNYHVVSGADGIVVTLDDGTELEAELVGTDPRTDLALLKVAGNDYPYVAFADERPDIGEWVLAVGNPFGYGGSVTAGIVSAHGRNIGAGPYDDFIQIDAPVNLGNSGGPSFNVSGEVVGVNTAIFSPSGGNVGIAFAIPGPNVERIVASLRDGGKVVRGWLGVQIQPVDDDLADSLGLDSTDGALVSSVMDNSPAEEAGLEAGDMIVSVNDMAVESPRALSRLIADLPPQSRARISLWRDGNMQTFSVRLGLLDDTVLASARPERRERRQGPRDFSIPQLGLSLERSPPGEALDGVTIADVESSSVAAEKGLRSGDIILEVAGRSVSGPRQVLGILEDSAEAGRNTVQLRVRSGDSTRYLALPIELS